MSSPKKSKKSSSRPSKEVKPKAKRVVNRQVIVAESLWKTWKHGEIHEIEFEGLKFKATVSGGTIYIGENLSKGQFGDWRNSQLNTYSDPVYHGNGAGSCAYYRLYPMAGNDVVAKIWKWYLNNLHMPRGYMMYLTRLDAGYGQNKDWEERLVALRQTLKNRGFKEVCENKSVHTGHYPVWLLVHPGDPALFAKKNKKNKKVSDVDVLGNTVAGNDGAGIAGNPVAVQPANPIVPDAPALAA